VKTIWHVRYELRPVAALNARASGTTREGALLRIGDGFADLHPWPELGDLPLDEQLRLLTDGTTTASTRLSIEMIRLDENARLVGKTLFEGLTIPRSHFLSVDLNAELDLKQLAEAGFKRIKVKAGRDLSVERIRIIELLSDMQSLGASLALRIDLNASVTKDDLEHFLSSIPERAKHHIDFLEDPLPYDPKTWLRLREAHGVRLAADREKPRDTGMTIGIDTIVLKPAREEVPPLTKIAQARAIRAVVTSNMDHPVGQMGAAFRAACIDRDFPSLLDDCGLLSNDVYEPDAFSERMVGKGAQLMAPSGLGIGFDDLLFALDWKELR